MTSCPGPNSDGKPTADLEQHLRSMFRASEAAAISSRPDGVRRVERLAKRYSRRRTAALILAGCVWLTGVGLIVLSLLLD